MNHSFYSPYMLQAIKLAEKSLWRTAPNPAVGAVLVYDGRIVAEGWHHKAGEPHAEAEVLRLAGELKLPLDQCTLIVTLEPCNHQGKTPPCTQAIIASGIRNVAIGTRDINTEAAGGVEALQQAGINVVVGVEEEKCKDLIDNFVIWQTTSLPYTIIKLASTLDGRIATRTGHSQWISSPKSREEVHHLRQKMDAVIIGGKTFYEDNPRLTCRLEGVPQTREYQPLAVVVSSRLPDAGANYHLLTDRPDSTIFWTTVAAAASPKAEALRKLGASVLGLPAVVTHSQLDKSWAKLDLHTGMQSLRQDHDCYHVLCEGGGKLALSLMNANLAHELFLHMCPKIIADNQATPLFGGLCPDALDEALQLRFISIHNNDDDVIARLKFKRPDTTPSTVGN